MRKSSVSVTKKLFAMHAGLLSGHAFKETWCDMHGMNKRYA